MPLPQTDPPKMDHLAPQWFHDYMDRLRTWLMNNRPVAGLNVQLNAADGRGLVINSLASATIPVTTPFLVLVQNEQFMVRLGTINNLVPSGLLSWQGFDPGDFVLLDVNTDGKQVVSATITSGESPSPPECQLAAPPTNFKVPLAQLTGENTVEQIVFDNLAAIRSVCHLEEKAYPISPIGSSPWNYWWTWTVVPELTPQLFPV